jgi:hypothetical protein
MRAKPTGPLNATTEHSRNVSTDSSMRRILDGRHERLTYPAKHSTVHLAGLAVHERLRSRVGFAGYQAVSSTWGGAMMSMVGKYVRYLRTSRVSSR